MSKYKRRQNIYKKLFCLLSLFIVAYLTYPKIVKYFTYLDTDKILAQSSLQNKKFTQKTQEINMDGFSAYLMEEHSVPIVSLDFAFKNAGSAYEDENKQGLTSLLADMLTNGAGENDALAFKDICAEYGIKIGFEASNDYFSGYMITPKQNLPIALKLMQDVLYHPLFDEDYLQLVKQQLLTILQMQNEQPTSILSNKFNENIFAGHPYSRPDLGKSENIPDISTEDLREYMQNKFAKNNLLIGMAGDITAQEAQEMLNTVFAKLNQSADTNGLSKLSLQTNGTEYNVAKKQAQVMTQFAVAGTYRNSIDFYPLYLANYIFGGSGLGSRISSIIREKEGLTYGIYTYLLINDASALLVGSFSSAPENFDRAKNLLLQEWHNMAEKGATQEELAQAKKSLLASYNLRFASTGDISSMLLSMQKFALGKDFLDKRNDYIEAVTLEEVNAAAKKYFRLKPDFVILGNITEEEN
ncbi:MAG: insulinase family protein [Alphaproteobacteria bacterium]|nr:insulinase family protein [Alphaproteobacteria bacterium]